MRLIDEHDRAREHFDAAIHGVELGGAQQRAGGRSSSTRPRAGQIVGLDAAVRQMHADEAAGRAW